MPATAAVDRPSHFIRHRIERDLASGKHQRPVLRFPPEPNGYLHIGHGKSLCLNFGLAEDYGGECHLRFDDTNPYQEESRFVTAIQEDVRWLGYQWHGAVRHASDEFERLHEIACDLIRRGLAFVCSLDAEAMERHRGTLTEPGRDSPYRERDADENLRLFEEMRAGRHPDGAHTLRARIAMDSPNLHMRDPVLYRILHARHHRSAELWCIYPTYDFSHCLCDALAGITHSLCTLEFVDHRPLYDWLVRHADLGARPRQIEFARLRLSHTALSKRRLKRLVDAGLVEGWDDPRMPTLAGMRRRGYPAEALREFCSRIGVARADSLVDSDMLDDCVRSALDRSAPRAMGVLDPLRVVLDNYPAGRSETVRLANHPKNPDFGAREARWSRELWIERSDFMLDPPTGFKRLSPGRSVRLRGAHVLRCESVERDADGTVSALRCRYDPDSLGASVDYPVGGVIHWLDQASAREATVHLYDRLFVAEDPEAEPATRVEELYNPHSLRVLSGCQVEALAADSPPGACWQFERVGYFCVDPDSTPRRPLFNRSLALRSSWRGGPAPKRAG